MDRALVDQMLKKLQIFRSVQQHQKEESLEQLNAVNQEQMQWPLKVQQLVVLNVQQSVQGLPQGSNV